MPINPIQPPPTPTVAQRVGTTISKFPTTAAYVFGVLTGSILVIVAALVLR